MGGRGVQTTSVSAADFAPLSGRGRNMAICPRLANNEIDPSPGVRCRNMADPRQPRGGLSSSELYPPTGDRHGFPSTGFPSLRDRRTGRLGLRDLGRRRLRCRGARHRAVAVRRLLSAPDGSSEFDLTRGQRRIAAHQRRCVGFFADFRLPGVAPQAGAALKDRQRDQARARCRSPPRIGRVLICSVICGSPSSRVSYRSTR